MVSSTLGGISLSLAFTDPIPLSFALGLSGSLFRNPEKDFDPSTNPGGERRWKILVLPFRALALASASEISSPR